MKCPRCDSRNTQRVWFNFEGDSEEDAAVEVVFICEDCRAEFVVHYNEVTISEVESHDE